LAFTREPTPVFVYRTVCLVARRGPAAETRGPCHCLPRSLIIGRGRFRPQPKETGKRLRINGQIRISPVRLIDDEDNQLGVVELDDAQHRAREAGLDLVEVAPQASPPVCKIMDYGKWKYAQKKKEQKAKSHAKQSELKGMRLRPKIDEHDLGIKLNKARDFLEDGDKVQFTMLFRGREMAHRDLGMRSMQQICDDLADIAKVESPPKMMGRRATMVLAPDKSGKAKKDAAEAANDEAPSTPPAPTPESSEEPAQA